MQQINAQLMKENEELKQRVSLRMIKIYQILRSSVGTS